MRSWTRHTPAFADFLGAASPDEIKFGYNMSTLTLHIGRSIGATLGPGDEIVVTTLDHEANVSDLGGDGRRSRGDGPQGRHPRGRPPLDLEDLRSKLNGNTRLVAVGYASNAVGTIDPVTEIVAQAHEVGALTYVDAVAYAPHGPIDVASARHRLPRVQRLQVVRPAPRRAVRQGRGPRSPAGVQGPPGARSLRDRHGDFEGIAGTLAATDYPVTSVDGSADQEIKSRRVPSPVAPACAAMRRLRTRARPRASSTARRMAGLAIRSILARRIRRARAAEAVSISCSTASIRAPPPSRSGAEGIFVWDGDFYRDRLPSSALPTG